MAKLKSAKHHWWPEGVSKYWKNSNGDVHRISPNGENLCIPPKNLGVIGNGHHIKLGKSPDESTVWDESFEGQFDAADSSFPKVIDGLISISNEIKLQSGSLSSRFVKFDLNEKEIPNLVESMTSLVVRSPMTRSAVVQLAEQLRGPLPEPEKNKLIGLNLRNGQRTLAGSIGQSGKFVLLFSPNREFIFGDGFYCNVTSFANPIFNPKFLVPLTPNLAVLYAKPVQYGVEPKFSSFVLQPDETDILNVAVQVYSCNEIFYRSEKPRITAFLSGGEHLRYSLTDNPVDALIRSIPGVR